MKKLVCITCPNGCHLEIDENTLEVKGNKCKRGEVFARAEMTKPTRSVTSTVRTVFENMPVVSVKTNGEIAKDKIMELMKLLKTVTVSDHHKIGEVVLPNVLESGVDVVFTKNV